MNKRQTRHFAIGCTVPAARVLPGLTIDSHRLLQADQRTAHQARREGRRNAMNGQ